MQENPTPGNGRPEDPAGLTVGMALVTVAPSTASQIINGTSRKSPPDKDKGKDYSTDEKQTEQVHPIEGELTPEGRKGSRQPCSCLPKSKVTPSLVIRSEGLANHIEYMKDHALIAKFIGFWPMEKDPIWWINHHWKPKGGYELRLGARGFFTVVFYNIEDKNKIFEGGPYFFIF